MKRHAAHMNKLKAAILILILALPLALPMGREALSEEKARWVVPLLHYAVRKQVSAEKMEELVDLEDADIHAVSPKGHTALHWAAQLHPDPEIIDILIDAGAEVDARDNFGNTPLHFASRSKNPQEIVPTLLDAGANPNAQANHGLSVLHLAVKNSHVAGGFVETLIKAEAKVNVKDEEGDTPLHYAAGFKKPEAILALLRAGADIHAKDSKGKTALDYAKEEGLPADVIKMLEDGMRK